MAFCVSASSSCAANRIERLAKGGIDGGYLALLG